MSTWLVWPVYLFVSIQNLRDGAILRWWDYWDLQTLMQAAPEWWIEPIMRGYA